MTLIIKILFFLIGCFFLKTNINKLRKLYLFFEALKDYKLFRSEQSLVFIAPLLICIELFISLSFITSISNYAVLAGIFMQLFYIFLNLKTINQVYTNNCGCFSMQTPRNVNSKSVFINIALLFIIIFLYGLKIRYY